MPQCSPCHTGSTRNDLTQHVCKPVAYAVALDAESVMRSRAETVRTDPVWYGSR